ncbi:hypothetical protein Pan153_17860 [Gimesia panareensis]|uniref:Type II secretion system protein GspG C-terminal domain-containing protein n=1 Tax=Gimesia panareensis TaxID=2527978 RepID=A0A518FLB2_9PLAN|nr:hypothetical protein [Gimesia panareensis]QDV17151.1 hypothetical protein Pan153_17860 [Gimesia panareensis]
MKRKIIVIVLTGVVGFLVVTGGVYLQVRKGQSMLTFQPNSLAAKRTKKQAQPIIDALERYYLKHHQYPDHLRSLVPAELEAESAPPEYGSPTWIYFQGGPRGECSVGFGADGGYPAWHFSLKRKEWYVDS